MSNEMKDATVEPMVWSVPMIAQRLGVCDMTVKRLIRSRKLAAKREGKRYICTPQQVQDYIDGLPPAAAPEARE